VDDTSSAVFAFFAELSPKPVFPERFRSNVVCPAHSSSQLFMLFTGYFDKVRKIHSKMEAPWATGCGRTCTPHLGICFRYPFGSTDWHKHNEHAAGLFSRNDDDVSYYVKKVPFKAINIH
jgi:hypothetical protein